MVGWIRLGYLRLPQNVLLIHHQASFWMVWLQLKSFALEGNIIKKCPQCGYKHENENSKHLTQCRDPGQLLQLHNSIKTIMDVLEDANIASKFVDIVEVYLLNQGRRSMVDCTHPTSRFLPISIDINNLG
jgi:hypothetical protein